MKALLMGGQACILYGAAEFSRDIDIAVAVSKESLERLRAALRDLEAEPIFFPPLGAAVLRRGHACHFRCRAPGLLRVRIDVMSVMRNADPFPRLWARRESMDLPGVGRVPVMSLPDLVRVKKTQRDKDWPMVRRLVEADIARTPRHVATRRAELWLRECRSPGILVDLARRYPALAARVARSREAVRHAQAGRLGPIERALDGEQAREREADRRYWAPLRAELEQWRLRRSRRARNHSS